jgi:CRP-like cAMP-binding protein
MTPIDVLNERRAVLMRRLEAIETMQFHHDAWLELWLLQDELEVIRDVYRALLDETQARLRTSRRARLSRALRKISGRFASHGHPRSPDFSRDGERGHR